MIDQSDPVEKIREIVERALRDYESALVYYVAGLLKGDHERARDVVQDSFMRLCNQDPEQIEENVKAWLYTVARNRAFDVIRKESRMVSSELVPDSEDVEGVDPANVSSRRDQTRQILRWVEDLPHNQKEVVLLRFQQNMSYKEIAEVTGLKTGNVGFLLHTGLKTLRMRLEQRRANSFLNSGEEIGG